MNSHTKPIFAALLLAVTALPGNAQRNPNRPLPTERRSLRAAQQPDSQGPNRAALEGMVRGRIGQMARRQLGLDDAQVQKLQATNARFADRRRTLMEQERDIRMSLRDEMISGDSSRQKQVGDLMDRMVRAQRQRIDLLEEEQRELRSFLTPMQRATYFGMEEQLRNRLDQMRQDVGGGPPGRAGLQSRGGPPGRGGRMRGGPPDGPPARPPIKP
ncbi:MAG: hypothetical protein CK531_01475 [Gemmatimonadetes bacterium]|nr:MAG: hypothetical protein CK531_01475 [Gemmatimonadota bacterium]